MSDVDGGGRSSPAGESSRRRRTVETFELAEGPRWFHGRWYFVDLLSGRLLTLLDADAPTIETVLSVEVPLGAVAAVDGEEPGVWLAALGDGIALVRHGRVTWLDRPEQGGPVPTRMNDAVCDPAGRLWAGSMGYRAEPGAGSLYRTDLDGTVVRVLDGLTIPNGPAFTADGTTMYLADSARGEIRRYPVDAVSGDLGAATPFVSIGDASPDGMVLDDEGHLWVALWGGARVDRYAPDATRSTSVPVTATQPTAPCFGGPDGRTLLVTSARQDIAAPGSADGAVLLLDAPVTGQPSRAAAVRA